MSSIVNFIGKITHPCPLNLVLLTLNTLTLSAWWDASSWFHCSKWVGGWVRGWVSGRVSGWVSGRVSVWVGGWVSQWLTEWINQSINQSITWRPIQTGYQRSPTVSLIIYRAKECGQIRKVISILLLLLLLNTVYYWKKVNWATHCKWLISPTLYQQFIFERMSFYLVLRSYHRIPIWAWGLPYLWLTR